MVIGWAGGALEVASREDLTALRVATICWSAAPSLALAWAVMSCWPWELRGASRP